MTDKISLDHGHPPPLYTKPGFFEEWVKQLEGEGTEKSVVEKAKKLDIAKLLKRQAKDDDLGPPLKEDDPFWEVDDAYQEELEARVEVGVKKGAEGGREEEIQ